jgi:hypothetical protein
MKTKLFARQGDVFIFKINRKKSTSNFKRQKEVVLALGEVTGHSHRLNSDSGDILLCEDNNGSNLFELNSQGILTHEEHETIKLPPGQYISIIQTEYDPIEHRRKVMD